MIVDRYVAHVKIIGSSFICLFGTSAYQAQTFVGTTIYALDSSTAPLSCSDITGITYGDSLISTSEAAIILHYAVNRSTSKSYTCHLYQDQHKIYGMIDMYIGFWSNSWWCCGINRNRLVWRWPSPQHDHRALHCEFHISKRLGFSGGSVTVRHTGFGARLQYNSAMIEFAIPYSEGRAVTAVCSGSASSGISTSSPANKGKQAL